MIACPACGTMHPATDLVCGACGKLLADNLPGDSSWAHLRETAGRNMALAKAHLVPRLARNFRMLGRDIAVDFRGTTSRGAFVAFTGVSCIGFLLVCASMVVTVLLGLALLLPSLAICVRRLRDTDISPWMAFAIPLLPFLLLVPSVKDPENDQPKEATE